MHMLGGPPKKRPSDPTFQRSLRVITGLDWVLLVWWRYYTERECLFLL